MWVRSFQKSGSIFNQKEQLFSVNLLYCIGFIEIYGEICTEDPIETKKTLCTSERPPMETLAKS